MKSIKHLILTSAIAASLAGPAVANTTIHVRVVGAPAFRAPVNDALEKIVEQKDPTFSGTAGLVATTASSVPANGSRLVGSSIESAKQNQWLIKNYTSSVDLEIDASFTGSTAGVESVSAESANVQQKFIPDFGTTGNPGTIAAPINSKSTPTAAAASQAVTADSTWLTASDTFQASTIFNGLQTFQGASATFTNNYQSLTPDLNGNPAGVEVYHWVASPNAPSDFTNITTAQAASLYTNGTEPLSFFTGNNADANTTVYALSRDPGSGARVIALAEIGVQPPGTDAGITTYAPNITANSGTTDSAKDYVGGKISDPASNINVSPAGTIPSTGISEPLGDPGYASFNSSTANGGTVADGATSANNVGLLQAITAAPPTGVVFVTYLDNDDTAEASTAGTNIAANLPTGNGGSAKLLTFNGVSALTTNGVKDPAVDEGQYDFWSYESFLAPSSQSSASLDIETKLESTFPTYAAQQYGWLNIFRTVDGGPLTHN